MLYITLNWLDKIVGKKTRVQPRHFEEKGVRAVDLEASRRTKTGEPCLIPLDIHSLDFSLGIESRLFEASLGHDAIQTLLQARCRPEVRIGVDVFKGGRFGMAPNPPSTGLSAEGNLLNGDVFTAVLNLLWLFEDFGRFAEADDSGFAHRLAGCHAKDDLADTGAGDVRKLGCAV